MTHKDKTALPFILAQLIVACIYMLIARPLGIPDTFLLNVVYYLVFFAIPVFIYVHIQLKHNPFTYLELHASPIRGILIGLAVAIFVTFIFFMTHNFKIEFVFSHERTMLLFGVILAGVFEEIPFRGFYLKVFMERWGFIKANLLTSLIFTLLHFQKIMTEGFLQLIILFIFSLWLGYLRKETKSLWAPIIVHMSFNVLTVLF